MDTRSGEMYVNPSEAQIKEKNLKPITEEQHERFQHLPPEKRPVELAIDKFMAGRPHLKGMHRSSVKQAFREGYKEGKEDNT